MNHSQHQAPGAAWIDPSIGGGRRTSPVAVPLQVLPDAFVGATALLLALDTGFAEGRVTFAGDAWRWVLAVTGLYFSFIVVRTLYRLVSGYRPHDPANAARRKRRAKLFILFGLWLVALAVVSPLGDNTIALSPWFKLGYGLTGGLNVLLRLVCSWDPTKHLQTQRVHSGEGIKGRARILRANDTGTSVNDAPQVKIDFGIELPGRDPYEANDKIVVQRAKLALLIPGSSLAVTVDSENREVFHLDWDDWSAPSPQADPSA